MKRAIGQRIRFFLFLFFSVFFVSLWFTPFAGAAAENAKVKPEWRSTRPLAVERGKTTVIRITGQDLAPKEITFDQPGITAKIVKVEALKPKNDDEKARGNVAVEAEVTAAAGLAPGVYPFKLIHDGGEQPVGKLFVDEELPELPDAEPNDSLRKPQVLPPGSVAVLGNLDKDGVDVFQITGKAGETWRFEVVAHRVGAPFEPCLRLRDARFTPLRVAVDEGEDCAIEYRLPADGPYLLEVFDADNRIKADFVYRLRVIEESTGASAHPVSIAQTHK